MSIEEIIDELVDVPSDENKKKYEEYVNHKEIYYLYKTKDLIPKSQEFFDMRRKAFGYRKECAIKLINAWVAKFKSSEGCPVQYRDTLNLVFTQISPIEA